MSYNTPNTEISAARQLLSAPITTQTQLNLTRTNALLIAMANGNALMVSGNGAAAQSTEEWFTSTQVWTVEGALPAVIGFDGIYQKSQMVLLNDGRILAMGGTDNGSITNRSETYSPTTHSWTVQGTMANARFQGCLVLLTAGPNAGKALAIGGTSTGSSSDNVAQCELYDPTTNTWSTSGAGTLNVARSRFTCAVLNNGNVLAISGFDTTGTRGLTAEIYNATTGVWTSTGSLTNGRLDFATATLVGGDVLAIGGNGTGGSSLSSVERFNGSTWSATGNLVTGRQNPGAALLTTGPNSGFVLVAGGNLGNAELYNPTAGTWASTGSTNSSHNSVSPAIVRLLAGANANKILIAGGVNTVSELYDPTAATWTLTAQTQQFAAEDWSARTLKDTAGTNLLDWSVPGQVTTTGNEIITGSTNVDLIKGRTGDLVLRPFANTTTGISFQNVAGTTFVQIDTVNGRLGVGGTVSGATFVVTGTSLQNGQVDLNVHNLINIDTLIGAGTTLKLRPTSNSTTAIQLQNAAGTTTVLNIDTSGNNVTLPQAANLTLTSTAGAGGSLILSGNTTGGSINLTSGTGNSGGISITTGTGGSGNTGSINLTTADVAGSSQTSGTTGGLTLTTGNNSSASGFASGNTGIPTGITISSGSVIGANGSQTGSSGNSGTSVTLPVVGTVPVALTITTGIARSLSGDPHTAGTSGSILITSGGVTTSNDNNLSSGAGGHLILTTGRMNSLGFFGGNNQFTGQGGSIWLSSGDAVAAANNNNTSGAGGSITLTSGGASGANSTNNSGAGGSLTLKSGDANNNIGTGGSINLTTGNSSGSATLTGGSITLTTGTTAGTANGGNITLTSSDATRGGNLSLTGTIASHGQLTVGGSSPSASASVDIQSTTRGFLPPRMTTTQKNAIATPATGLVIYDTTLNLLQLYNGTSWTSVGATINFAVREVPSGSVNGVNAVFTLANTPVVGSEEVFLNGLLQNVGALNDYTISGAIITFNTAPDSGGVLLVSYRF